MAPVDPKMLLKALNPLLGKTGCVKGVQEAERITALMKDANKLVSQCVYISILKVTTDEQVLNKFIECGGWDVLYSWLQECKKGSNEALLQEILKVYMVLPVTVELLKQNSCAKTIKSVGKSSENEDIKKLSTDIVNQWMKTVRGDSTSESSNTSKKKKKPENGNDSENIKNGEKSKHNHHHKDHKERRNSNEKKDSSKQSNDSSNKKDSANSVEKERPKTVKLHNSKFRSTGLEEDVQLPKVIKKKSMEPAKTIKRPIVPSTSKLLEPPEKKIKPSSTTTVTTSTTTTVPSTTSDRVGGVKMIPARPKPNLHLVTESSGFMDAISTAKPVVRKRKKTSARPTTPTSPTPPKQPAVPSFYQDTLDTNGDEALSPESKEEDSVANSEAGDQSEASESSSTLDGSAKKKKKKTVSWANDTKLHTFHYFEMEDGERVNVNRVKDFDEMKKKDLQMDRQAVENVKKAARDARDKMAEQITWYRPVAISELPEGTEKGSKSKEHDIQKAREISVLQIIFFSKESLPDSATEPDPVEYSPPGDPIIIPLDEPNADGEDPGSTPPIALPDDIANLVASVAQQGTAPQLLSNVMGGQSPPQDLSTDQLKQILGNVGGSPQEHGAMPMGPGGRGGLLGNAPPNFRPPGPGFFPGPGGRGMPPPGPGGMPPGGQWMGGPRMRGPMPGRGAMRGGRGGIRGPPKTPCRFFMTKGSCRNGMMCTFLHPGINGPPPPQPIKQ